MKTGREHTGKEKRPQKRKVSSTTLPLSPLAKDSPLSARPPIFFGMHLVYNVVLVSTIQQSESAVCIHISPLFWIYCLYRSPQSAE